jgi:hypothetical protein
MKKSQLEDMWRHIQKIEFEAYNLENPSKKLILREVNRMKAQIQLFLVKESVANSKPFDEKMLKEGK